jgi:hypothetical protein
MKIENFKRELVSELIKTGYYSDQSAKIIVSELDDSDFLKDYSIDEDFRGAIRCIEDCYTEVEKEPQEYFDLWALSNGSFLVYHV